MQTYDATVRLAGDLGNTVCKVGLTAPEVLVLQAIHGSDAVVDIAPKTMDKRPHLEERDRLEETYGGEIVMRLFGAPYSGLKLPVVIDGFSAPAPAEEAAEGYRFGGMD